MDLNNPTLETVYWTDVRDKVAQVNPKFAQIVDQLAPDKKFPLYLARYPYGSLIVSQGELALPKNISSSIKEKLAYSQGHLPWGMMLENSIELFIDAKGQIIPAFIQGPGKTFGLWREFDTKPSFYPDKLINVSSGARSIFMIPNIGDIYYHKNLKRDFNLRLSPPKTLASQWEIFKALTQHPNSGCRWQTSILFFSQNWLDALRKDSAWGQLYAGLLQQIWVLSSYWRNKVFYDYTFSCMQANRRLKPNPYLADSVKHLIQIALGVAPGFSPKQDNLSAPVDLLQQIYIESYRLKKYVPTLMAPAYFNAENSPVYYSLQFPSTMEFSPKARKLTSTVSDLSEIKHVANIYLQEIASGKLQIEDTALGQQLSSIQFDYFQSKQDRHGEVVLTNVMPIEDPKLIECRFLSKVYPQKHREFAETGTFNRGCVRVMYKKHKEKENVGK